MPDDSRCESGIVFGVLSAETVLRWCCQSNANQSPLLANEQVLGDEKVAPFAKSGVSFLFEPNSGVNVPFEFEVIVH